MCIKSGTDFHFQRSKSLNMKQLYCKFLPVSDLIIVQKFWWNASVKIQHKYLLSYLFSEPVNWLLFWQFKCGQYFLSMLNNLIFNLCFNSILMLLGSVLSKCNLWNLEKVKLHMLLIGISRAYQFEENWLVSKSRCIGLNFSCTRLKFHVDIKYL